MMAVYDFVVYGGDPWAVAAAVAAKKVRPSMTVALVVDYPVLTSDQMQQTGLGIADMLGGISTVGGQTTWDDPWLGRVMSGTYKVEMLDKVTRYYNPESLGWWLRDVCQRYGITVYHGYHAESAATFVNPYGRRAVEAVTFRPIRFLDDGTRYIDWDPNRGSITLQGQFFADCSVDARLMRIALGTTAWTYGRYDWPSSVDPYANPRTQAVTLCVRLGGFPVTSGGKDISRATHGGHYGGAFANGAFLRTDSALAALNRQLYTEGGRIMMGPSNWAQEYPAADVVWATGPHLFNVAIAWEKDRGTALWPSEAHPAAYSLDRAYYALRNELLSGRYLAALRQDLGVSSLQLLAVAPILYVRESWHGVVDAGAIQKGSEGSNYVITPEHAILAGSGPSSGADAWAYSERVGVALYGIDQHGYFFTDHYDPATGTFYWHQDVARRLRPDLTSKYGSGWMAPQYGFYVPWRVMISPYSANLLLAGYGALCCNLAWGEFRVAPSLCVLGDAAGATVAVILNQGTSKDLNVHLGRAATMQAVQSALAGSVGANLDTKR